MTGLKEIDEVAVKLNEYINTNLKKKSVSLINLMMNINL